MTRSLESALVTEITADKLSPVMFAEFFFDSGTVRFWSGYGDVITLGYTWTGAGNILSLSPYNETASLEAQGFKFGLNGISSSIISLALSENYQGRPCKLYMGALNSSGALVASPNTIFVGFMDTIEINEGGETCNISLSAENKMVILTRSKERRYTAEDQKSEYVGDLGFDFVALMQDQELIWKAKA